MRITRDHTSTSQLNLDPRNENLTNPTKQTVNPNPRSTTPLLTDCYLMSIASLLFSSFTLHDVSTNIPRK